MVGFGSVTFDEHNPNTEKGRENEARSSKSGLDYSPLPRVTGKSLSMGILISMGGLIFGYDTGQISGFLEMPDFLERFGQVDSSGTPYFSRVRSGLIVSLLSIGTLIGAISAAPIADRFGRRPSISFWSLITSVGFVIQIAASTAWYQVMIGRFVAGLGVGALSLLVPMYQAETAPAWIRGAMVCAYQLFITMGIFLAACFNYGTYHHQMDNSGSWRIVIGLGWIWTAVLGVGILFFPETPRYNYRRGRTEEAVQTICDVHGAQRNHWVIHTQVAEIESKLHAESKIMKGPIAEFVGMWKAPRMLYRLFLGITLQSLQQLSGANFFFYYGVSIFKSVNIDSYITQIILNTINFLVTFIGLYIVERFGRRKSLITGSIWMFVCFLIFASVGHFALDYKNPENTPTPGIVLIVFAALFILGFATTWGPMIWTIQAEIFPSRYRAKGMAISTAANWIWNFCIGFFTPFITGAIDYRYGYVFAACNFVAAFVVYFFVIEGQGRTIEEIDTMYLERVTPWKSTKWVPPDEERMEQIRREAGIDVEALAAQNDEHSKIAGDSNGGGVRVDGSNMNHVE
ncbi:siderophore iron transporter mirC [Cordyceps fumosorosea ARSEF 2679]|uniref:Siderophore iron transporter mirC n=1 Tax=Cordyceps fumosorosea (strain ARSEF 2679) TaxID=1081104 RepID=A0A168EEW7_CORFA|nr:siderophore iron transporter mirC [Cordyceps fumosorosea ARSEF 2679]OAA73730.1 siderophore iron transporter mirC [Cordyceps fumosorosea ARSEF 2679]